MYNMSVINPAYATDDNSTLNVGLLYRWQWAQSTGRPTTGTFFAHSVITDRLEGGISIVHDQIGDVVKQSNAYADIAYVLPVSETSKLSFGIKAGATFFSTNFDGFVYSDPLPDPAFAENISRTFPNVGAGLFFFSENYYLGSVDLTANVLFNDLVEFGASYRFNDSFAGMANLVVSDGFRIGYAYDHTISNLGRFNSGSHEIFLLFNISKYGKGYDKSPRFF